MCTRGRRKATPPWYKPSNPSDLRELWHLQACPRAPPPRKDQADGRGAGGGGAQRGEALGCDGSRGAARGGVARAKRLRGKRIPLEGRVEVVEREGEEGSARVRRLISRRREGRRGRWHRPPARLLRGRGEVSGVGRGRFGCTAGEVVRSGA